MGKSQATGVMCLASETNEPRQPKQHLSTNHLLSAQYDPWCYVTDRKMFMGQRLTWRKTGLSTFILQWECNFNYYNCSYMLLYISVFTFSQFQGKTIYASMTAYKNILWALRNSYLFRHQNASPKEYCAISIFHQIWSHKLTFESDEWKGNSEQKLDHLFDFLSPWSYTLKWPSSNSQVGLNNDTSWTHSQGCCILNS